MVSTIYTSLLTGLSYFLQQTVMLIRNSMTVHLERSGIFTFNVVDMFSENCYAYQ